MVCPLNVSKEAVVAIVEKMVPDLRKTIETTDVSTPATVFRYRGNRQGSMEGWLLTPGCCSCESNAGLARQQSTSMLAAKISSLELSKHGLAKRDIVSNLNFFMNAPIDSSGNFTVVDGTSAPGNHVDVTAEIDVLLVISNCPQVNNPCNGSDSNPSRAPRAGGIMIRPRWSNLGDAFADGTPRGETAACACES